MSARRAGDLIGVEHVLYAKVESNGAVTVHIGDVHGEETTDEDVPVFQSWGFVSLPAPPTPKQSGAEVVVVNTGGADHAIAGRDVRGMAIAGAMQMGESCAYASLGAARTLWKKNGSITHYTTTSNDDSGQSIFDATLTTGKKIVTPWGVLTITSDGIQMGNASNAFIKISGDTITISAPNINLIGGAVALGAAATAATPAIYGPSGISGVASTSVRISP